MRAAAAASTTTTTFDTTDSSTTSPGFRCAKSVASEGPSGVKPHGYQYDNVKKKRPPGVGDPIKDGGKGAEEMVQAIAAEQGAEGLQKWMDKFGMGGEVRRYCELRRRASLTHPSLPAASPPTSLISSRQVMMAKDARKREGGGEAARGGGGVDQGRDRRALVRRPQGRGHRQDRAVGGEYVLGS